MDGGRGLMLTGRVQVGVGRRHAGQTERRQAGQRVLGQSAHLLLDTPNRTQPQPENKCVGFSTLFGTRDRTGDMGQCSANA